MIFNKKQRARTVENTLIAGVSRINLSHWQSW